MRFKKLAADITDLLICAILAAIFSVAPAAIASGFRVGASVLMIVEIVMTYAFFLLKDIFERSFGKRLFRVKIVNWEGKGSTLGQRIIRNIPLILFPVSFILMIAGYDTLGDNLAATCVVGEKDTGVPGMRKGNNLFRIITLALCAAVVVTVAAVYVVRDLVIKNTDGYDTLVDYMNGGEIAAKYGEDPVWKVKKYDKIDDGYLYALEVNGKELEVTTVLVNNKWFVLGVQTENVNKLVETIKKSVGEKTVYLALADLDFDGKNELLEFCTGDDSDTHCNIYGVEDGEPAGTLIYNNGSVASVGVWTLCHDVNGSDKVMVEYSHFTSLVTEKYISMIEKDEDGFTLREMFREVYTTGDKTVTDEEGNQTTVKTYTAEFFCNSRQVSPTDYYSNFSNYEARYTPVTSDGLHTFRWQTSADLSDQALDAATDLIYGAWQY